MMHAPKFWFKKAGLRSMWLSPIAALWSFQTARRLKRAPQKIDMPVICVGNISMGGTGKTPTAIYLAQALNELGYNPFILSRGFGGSIEGPMRVTPDHIAKEVGDEAVLMAYFAPVIVSRDRMKGGAFAQEQGADILIMDDGFQNPDLHKDMSIIVVDSDVGFGNGKVFPSGPLREPIQAAIKRADVVLLIGEGKKRAEIETAIGSSLPIVSAHLAPVDMGVTWKDMRVFAFAGIGRPEKFFKTLKNLGANVIVKRSFGDHEEIPTLLLDRMQNEAWSKAAQLVTTEKDAARLPKNWQGSVLSLPVRLQIDEGDLLSHLRLEKN